MGCDTLVALAPATRDGVTLFAKNSDRPARECQRLDNTTAALVAALPADPSTPLVAWVCLGSPCTSAFLPCYLDGRVPAALACGGAEPEAASPWWRLRELLSVVERDFARFGPPVRARWDAFETTVAEEARALEAAATSRRRRGESAEALLTSFMERTVETFLAEAAALVREMGAQAG